MFYINDIHTIRKCFYSNNVFFKNFKNINREDIGNINEKVKNFIESWQQNSKNKSKTEFYLKVLKKLTTTNNEFKSFDEKLMFLIKCLDPNLKALTIYLSYNFDSLEEIQKKAQNDEKVYKQLIEKRQKDYLEYQNKLLESLGFCDTKLAYYELA